MLVVAAQETALAVARGAGAQEIDDPSAVAASVNIVAKKNHNRRAGQTGVVNRSRLQQQNHVSQKIGAAKDVANGIANPAVKEARGSRFRALEQT